MSEHLKCSTRGGVWFEGKKKVLGAKGHLGRISRRNPTRGAILRRRQSKKQEESTLVKFHEEI